jgi:hypothetical protein
LLGSQRSGDVVFESPSAVTALDAEAFSFCSSFESISIRSSVQLTSMPRYVLSNCRDLRSFYIPPHVQCLEGITFSRSDIIDVEVDPDNQWFNMVDSY